jgi:hypothetical protein
MPDLCHGDAVETNELAVGLRKLRRDQPRFLLCFKPILITFTGFSIFYHIIPKKETDVQVCCVWNLAALPRGEERVSLESCDASRGLDLGWLASSPAENRRKTGKARDSCVQVCRSLDLGWLASSPAENRHKTGSGDSCCLYQAYVHIDDLIGTESAVK